ncbi:hypothetical protein F4781DRAFT_324895 [Annulohypoxylon bovei var. microspora]|nr:hypothetical protein F4781DRAFT_324895 [Annulohypoxylon bovei var. microspora]
MAPSHKPEIIVIDDDSDDLDPFSDIDSPDVSIIDISENMDLMPPNRKPPHDARTLCKDNVRAVFPDICPDYLEKLANEHNNNSAAIIGMILDSQEKGEMYPARPHENPLKRKRSQVDNSDDGSGDEKDKRPDEGITRAEAIKANIAEPGYRNNTREKSYVKISTKLLASEVPIPVIRKYLSKNAGSVLEAHIAMNNALRNWNDDEPPWVDKAVCSPGVEKFESGRIEDLDMSEYNEFEKLAIAELRAARQFRNIEIENASAKAREEHDFNRAKATGQTDDCGCCFEECVINRMIHCDGENAHRFCRDCMKSQVEANIGLSKHELTCMSMDGCSAGFSLAQRKLFLDKATRTAFERLEQEAALRMAGIENLETCPFCPYAAEYPPPEVNKEFRCDNPGCEKVSCRLCRKESHIPKTCAEYAAEHGLEARHILEEAMSEAVIRKCNNCKHPYMKSEGCNKVVCTRCGTKQCYVCRKTITDYKHFNDTSRGGQRGQCPLFDRIDRHEREIQEAEAETRKKVEKDNPGLVSQPLCFITCISYAHAYRLQTI